MHVLYIFLFVALKKLLARGRSFLFGSDYGVFVHEIFEFVAVEIIHEPEAYLNERRSRHGKQKPRAECEQSSHYVKRYYRKPYDQSVGKYAARVLALS